MSLFTKLYQQLDELDGASIIVGVQSEPGTNFHGQMVASESELLKIAHVHEFGCDIEVTPKMRAWLHHNGIHLKPETTHIHIPERSFIRRAQVEGKRDFKAAMDRMIGELLSGRMTVDEILDALGLQALTETVANMGDGTKPVSSFAMERRKASANPTPLTDTGLLQSHITYRIEKRGGGQ